MWGQVSLRGSLLPGTRVRSVCLPVSETRGPSAQGRSLVSHQQQSCFFSKWKSVLPSWENSKNTGWAAAAPDSVTPSFPGLQIPQPCSPPPVMCNLLLSQLGIHSHVQVQHLSLPLGTTSHLPPIQTVPEGRPHSPPTSEMGV